MCCAQPGHRAPSAAHRCGRVLCSPLARRAVRTAQRECDLCGATCIFVTLVVLALLPLASFHSALMVNSAYRAALRLVTERHRLMLTLFRGHIWQTPVRLLLFGFRALGRTAGPRLRRLGRTCVACCVGRRGSDDEQNAPNGRNHPPATPQHPRQNPRKWKSSQQPLHANGQREPHLQTSSSRYQHRLRHSRNSKISLRHLHSESNNSQR